MSNKLRVRVLAINSACLLIFGLGGCGGKSNSPVSGSASSAPQPVSAGLPLTDDECTQFATSYEKAMSTTNISGIDDLMNWDAIFDRAVAGVEAPAEVRQGFLRGIRTSAGKEGGLARKFSEPILKGGSYKFLRVRSIDNQRRVLSRLILPDGGGYNYHDVVITRETSGKVRGQDIYVYLSGEFLADTFRRSYLPAVAHGSRGAIERLRGAESAFVKNLPKITEMSQALGSNNPQRVLALYQQLPGELQQDKNILLIRLQAAQNAGEKEYGKALDDFRTYHPTDACIDMLSTDAFILKKEFANALESVNRIDKAVGGDPYLNVVRAAIYIQSNHLEEARKAAQKAAEQEPSLLDAYWTQVSVSLKAKAHAETLKLLLLIREKFAIQFGDLTTLPDYADFVKSPQYKAWLNVQKPVGKDGKVKK